MKLSIFAFMAIVLSIAGACAQARLPKSERDVQGAYMVWSGFEVTKYEFGPRAKLTIGSRFDHPGGKTWQGTWTFAEGVIHGAISYVAGGKRLVAPVLLVPIAWGDRLMLVNAEELLSGGLMRSLKRVGTLIGNNTKRRFGDQKTDLMVLIRAKSADAELPKIYGAPQAPSPYDQLVTGLWANSGAESLIDYSHPLS